MNKIFKVIWNPATGSYNVASETAKSRGKKSGRSKLLISALVAGGLLSSFGALADNYEGQPVDYGNGSAGDGWVAIGKNSKANTFVNGSGASTALGYDAIAEGEYSSAIGSRTHAIGGASMAFGVSAISEGDRSIALGASSYSLGQYSMALGRYSKALGKLSIAMGDYSKADGANAIALGNIAKAAGIMSIGLGDNANASKDYAMALGASSNANGTDSLALGRQSLASAANAIAMGAESEAAENATAIGNNAHAKGVNSIAMGSGSIADKVNTIALGNGSQSLADNAIAIGQGNKANGTDAIALGNASLSSGLNSIALGKTSVVTGDNSLALGSNTNANGINSVALGADSIADQDNSVSVGSSSLQRKIVNVKNGAIKADSHDAINGSQLYAISDSIAKRLGGGSSVNPDDGTVNAPTYNLKNGNKNNVGSALTVLDENTLQWDQIKGKYSAVHGSSTTSVITDVANGTISAASKDAVNGSQLYDLQQDALLWNGTAFSAAHGTEATSKITNVTAGNLTASSTDAVNGSQLKTTNDNVTTNTTNIATNTTNITNLTDSVGDLKDDSLLWNKAAGAFSAAHGTEATSKITNLLAGKISSNSTDAINGSQLYGVADSFTSYLGGGADISDTGVLSGPTYTIGGTDYTNVGDALAAINTSFSTSLGDALLWDATAGKFSAKHGINNAPSVITDVANGAVSSTSSDAINGSQLYSTNKYIADALGGDAEVNADGTITAPTYTIANTDYNNVGEALDALDDNALLWDEDAGAYNASHDGNASKITNVAAGDLSTTSTDAVNGSQLNATNILVTQNSQMINQLAGNTSETYIEENGAGINYVRTNDNGLAFNDASASGIGATAVGYNSVAEGDSSVAIGQGSSSSVDTGIALGSSSVSSRVIVKGSRNTSVTENGVVIGYDTTDGELLGALSIGDDGKYRQIINVADGSEAHDAVTVRQLQNAIGAVATTPTKYFHANSTAEDSLAVGEDSLAMGAKTIVNGNAGIGIGLNTLVLADAINGIAIGSNARANHADSIAMGNGSQTTRGAQTNYTAYNMDAPQNSVGEFSVGSEDGQRQITNVAAGSADTDAVNVGQLKVTDAQVSQNTQSITNLNTQVTNLDTRVTNIENGIGDIVTTGSTKYFKTNTDGADANAQGKDSVAIGSGSIAAADNSVALGTGSVADEENTISVGSSTNQRRITNVAAGVNATDAVNVSQLKSSEAGGVRYDTKADGSVDYSNITLGGGNGGTTRISNVSAGVNNNDAVNYAQLKQSVQETKQYTDQRMVEMDNKLSKTESKLSGGIASAMAMTGLPQAYTPGASMASIGGGTYNGESAVALGVSMVSANGRWVYKLQGSTNSQGEYSAALGAGIQW
ncbi:Adhesin yadA precursor [Escherichia coli]|uniref:YadA-like family protein n=1 Tax=Escherichia coli TaxID=562 RepID=UPI00181FDCF9|nr:YadA-like family protein [Escherichia coli]EFC7368355.1 adhesin [Escherichia coli]CAD5770596.1 Adhesin yadA precursor [Escherichia coli]HBB0171981.1 adhesin [Escherichia coli]